jgi:hypothetical protein
VTDLETTPLYNPAITHVVDNDLDEHDALLQQVADKVGYPVTMVNRWLSDALAGYVFNPGTPAFKAITAYYDLEAGDEYPPVSYQRR